MGQLNGDTIEKLWVWNSKYIDIKESQENELGVQKYSKML